jgi:hypothetical protein
VFWFPKRGDFSVCCLWCLILCSSYFDIYVSEQQVASIFRVEGIGPKLQRSKQGEDVVNYIGELQEMSLIKIMGKGEGIDYWPHPLQPHIQSSHLFYSYSYSCSPPPPPPPNSSLQLQSAIGLDNLDFLPPLVPV